MFWFDYALIRYTPNIKRGETINIGLVVFLEGRVDVKITTSYSKVRMIDGNSTHEDIDKLKSSILLLTESVDTSEEQYDLLLNLNMGIFLSNKSHFALDHLDQYEDKIKHLFNELVTPYASKERIIGTSRLTTRLKRKFQSLELLAKDASELSKHKIVSNYPINKDMGLTADFLLKNGIYHLSEVIDFNVNDTQNKLKETSFKMMTFMESKKALNGPVNCYFIYSVAHKKESEVTQHINLAENYSDKMFNIASDQEFKKYLSMISDLTQTEIPLFH